MEFIGNAVIAKLYYLLIWLNTHILAEKIFRLKPVGISRIEFDKNYLKIHNEYKKEINYFLVTSFVGHPSR